MNRTSWLVPVALAAAVLGCDPDSGTKLPTEADRGPAPESAPPPRLKRLTDPQYRNTMRDLFGEEVLLPANLEVDERRDGLLSVGASETSISAYGVEKYESAAYAIAAQLMDSPSMSTRWLSCEPEAVRDDACADEVLSDLGRVVWRRPLSADERDALVGVSGHAATTLGDFFAGLEYGVAALLMSPHFLYRVELGDGPQAPEQGYDDWEMASRLSFFLWNTSPDAWLLDAAERGELTDDDALEGIVERMLDDPRARDGVDAFFTELFHLDELDGLTKDPGVFTYLSDDLADSARTETLSVISRIVFDDDAPYRTLLTTRQTMLDRTLATIYDVPAPTPDGFGPATLPVDGGRRGLLGQASFLLLQSHAASTSVTLRGMFIREVLLCTPIPEPPADANTAIPEVDEDARTMRERIAVHLEDPSCAGCHTITDPLGLGLENFDGLARWRGLENGVQIDASGDLDGVAFQDGWELAAAVADHRQLGPCLTENLLKYATSSPGEALSDDTVDWHTAGFTAADQRVRWLLRDVAVSTAFRGISGGDL